MTIAKFEAVVCDLTEQIYDLKQRLQEEKYAKNILLDNYENLKKENKKLKVCSGETETKIKQLIAELTDDDISMDFSKEED